MTFMKHEGVPFEARSASWERLLHESSNPSSKMFPRERHRAADERINPMLKFVFTE
jgi:hypothetical protein